MSGFTTDGFPDGARFVKAALQVNPFEYLRKNGKSTQFQDEGEYNTVLIERCLDNDIQLIAVTDHYSIRDSMNLLRQATDSGLVAFPGFEAVTSDGIHALCIFDPSTGKQKIERCIGACGVHDKDAERGLGSRSFEELLALASDWDAVVIAAHITGSGGLLTTLEGSPRQQAWTNEALIAAALAIPMDDVDRGKAQMIRGTLKGYQRSHPIAVIYSADVSDPDKLGDDTSWSWIKVSEPTIDGLRHGFLDPDSRVRLPNEYEEPSNRRIVSVTWKGGFLDGVSIPLNPALNVVVGPRGSGKSTVLESIRFVLDCDILGNDARIAHDGFVSQVLRSGTEVTLEVAGDMDVAKWRISRAAPSGALLVVGPDGVLTDLEPMDLLGRVEVYGQHEVAELARMPAQRSRLLERFVPSTPQPPKLRAELKEELAANRETLVAIWEERSALTKELDRLPAIEARLATYQKAGAKNKLEQEAGYRREEPLLARAAEMVDNLALDSERVDRTDSAFLADDAISDLPSKTQLKAVRKTLEKLGDTVDKSLDEIDEAIKTARTGLAAAQSDREARREKEREDYLSKLRDLQAENIDGEQYLALEQELAELEQKREKLKPMLRRADTLNADRQTLLDAWYGLQQREHDGLRAAGKRVTDALRPSVRIVTDLRGDRTRLIQFLRERISGQLNNVLDAVESAGEMSPREFAEACRIGPDALEELLGISGKQVEKTCDLDAADLLELEEIWLNPTTSIELKVGEDATSKPIWQGLEHLSTGQKATAILLVLLLDSTHSAPLVVDQPEDDLDNAFIADDVVPKLRSEKHSRQFLLSTHNPNIPVLGDAEQVIRLTAVGEAAAGGRASVAEGHTGSLDRAAIRSVVEALEGGRKAFERRRRRYGY